MSDQPGTRDLPEHVRRIVDQLENEIGERSMADDPGDGSLAPSTNGDGIEPAVRHILSEIGEDPDRPGLVGAYDVDARQDLHRREFLREHTLARQPDGAGDVDAGRAAEAETFFQEKIEDDLDRFIVGHEVWLVDANVFDDRRDAAKPDAFGD